MRKIAVFSLLMFALSFSHEVESELNFKQVMQLVNQSASKMLQGFLLGNYAMVLEGAREIAEHTVPKGGPLRYIDPSKREEFMRFMPAFEKQVHGGAEEVMKFLREGKRDQAFKTYTNMLQGCIACHELFRDRIGGR